ncbi:MAG: SPOR domain-containing protein [Pseudomonadales bacterium]|nr:SPOR domain-containing protein [Pseudomonadales bacterium]
MTSSGKGVYPDYIGTGENLGLPDKLAYLVSYGELFVAVISKKKENPKIIVNNLVSILGEGSPISHLDPSQLHADQLPVHLARDFGLDQDRSISLKALSDFSKGLRDQGHKPVIIVKDANRVKERVLRALFSIAEKCQLGLVIFAGPSFLRKKLYRDFSSNIYACHLSEMRDADLRSYIRRSQDEDLQASDAQLEEILHRAEGSAERIDGLIDELIETPRRRIGTSAMHLSVIIVMITLGIFLYGADYFQDNKEDNLAIDLPIVDLPAAAMNSRNKPLILIESTPDLFNSDSLKPNSLDNVEADQLLKAVEEQIPSKAVRGYITTPEVSELPLKSSPQLPPTKAAVKVLPVKEALSLTLAKDSWIIEADATDYTLQVMGSSSEERINEFINSQASAHAFTYYETSRGGQSWFVLTVGQYQSREEALAAIANLPPNIQVQVPWARNVGSIRSVLVPQ